MPAPAPPWLALLAVFCLGLGVAAQEPPPELPEVVVGLLEQADRDHRAGREERAIEGYREAIRRYPATHEAYRALGTLLHQRGELEASLAVFVDGLAQTPDDADLSYNAGVVALALDRLPEALERAERATALDPENAAAHVLRGTVLRRLDRPVAARAALETAVELAPEDAGIYLRLGNLYHHLGEKRRAETAYRTALEHDQTLNRARYNLGAVLFELGELEPALTAYREALEPVELALAGGEKIDPLYAQAYRNLGAIHVERQDWAAAAKAYETALELEPGAPRALYGLGYARFRTGELEPAAEAYRRALAADPELPLAYLHLGHIHHRRDELEQAVSWLEHGLPRLAGAERRDALALLADAYHRRGETGRAAAAYRELLALAPEDVAARRALGRLLLETDDVAGARAELEQAYRLAADDPAVIVELAELLAGAGELQRARLLYREALAASGGSAPAVERRLVRVLLRQGDLGQARRRLAAILATPGAPPADAEQLRRVHGLLLARAGELETARRELAAAGDGFETRAARGVVELLAGDGEAGLRALAAALDTAGDDPARHALVRADLGLASWLGGRSADARRHLDDAGAVFPGWPELALARAGLATAAGDHDAAAALLQNAHDACDEPFVVVAPPPAAGWLPLVLGEVDGAAACARIRARLAAARARAALDALARAADDPDARRRARRHLDAAGGLSRIPAAAGAVLRFTAGSLALLEGDPAAAREILDQALTPALPATLRPAAHNNLAVALVELRETDAARAELDAARAAGLAAAELNLGIVLDDHAANGAIEALERYRAYLDTGAVERREEVVGWIERLSAIYEGGSR